MPVQKRSRVASFALSALASAIIGAAVLPPAHAAGLGKLTVLSALGQPLRAEIELTAVTPEEAADLAVKLAPLEAFRAANIEFNPALVNLRFDIEQRDGRRFIRVTSAQPVNEPFVDMLLELSWANGRLVREYTFLLDPADMRNAQSPQVAAPVEVNRAAAQAGAPATTAAPAGPAASSAPAPARERPATAERERPAASENDNVRVKRGDTLSGIARDVKPADVSLDMMLVALYRANPEAFSGNNMNRLKSGRILSVPDGDTVRATDRSEARRVVIAHAADFNAYRNRLAGQVEAAKPAQAPAPQQSAGGKITAQVEERPNAVNEAQDRLKLSKAGEASGKAGQAAATEEKIAKEQQVADAAARVKELEKNVSDLEKLMAVKSQAGVEAQQGAVPEMDIRGAPVAAAPQPMAPAAAPAAPPARPAAKPAAPPPTVAPSPAEPGIMDAIKDNMAALGIALAAILGGTALILARRRKAAATVVEREVPVAAPVEPATQSLIAEPGGQSVDTSNSVFNSNFAPSASQLDMNEVDPVAEADVYIAYGRDAQAEEILKEALRTHPERHAVRLKLMEIYANRKDSRAFEGQANELYALTKGQGDEWAQAAALGRSFDPDNPLYGAQGGAGPLAATAAAAGAAALAADAVHSPAPPADFSAVLDDAARARAAEPAPHEGLDLDLSQEPAPEAAVSALDFDFADTPAAVEPATEDRLADFDFSDATAQPDAPAAEPPATPAQPKMGDTADAEHYLDFDLGGLDFDPPSPAPGGVDKPADKGADAATDPFDLAFDAPATSATPATPAARADADFDFDLGPDDKTPPAAAAPGADPLAELDLMDFDMPPPAATPAGAAAPTLDEPDMALPDLPEPPAAAPPPPEFDLSGIDLELDETATPQDGAADTPAPLTPLQMEMDTKLDLAVAYQEIGDKEGARELLDEVLRGGSSEQVARANQMLAQLG